MEGSKSQHCKPSSSFISFISFIYLANRESVIFSCRFIPGPWLLVHDVQDLVEIFESLRQQEVCLKESRLTQVPKKIKKVHQWRLAWKKFWEVVLCAVNLVTSSPSSALDDSWLMTNLSQLGSAGCQMCPKALLSRSQSLLRPIWGGCLINGYVSNFLQLDIFALVKLQQPGKQK